MRLITVIGCMVLGITLQPAWAQDAKAQVCSAPEHHQFDFWVGDWDVSEAESTTHVARVKVERILDGCVLHEIYEDTASLKGESFTVYDQTTKRWHQNWVTNKGQLLVVEGVLRDGAMVLSGSDRVPGGRRLVRASWKPLRGTVRETALRSSDGGKTWKLWFDLVFRPHK